MRQMASQLAPRVCTPKHFAHATRCSHRARLGAAKFPATLQPARGSRFVARLYQMARTAWRASSEISQDKAGKYRFRFEKPATARSSRTVEAYETKASAKNGIESVKKNAPTPQRSTCVTRAHKPLRYAAVAGASARVAGAKRVIAVPGKSPSRPAQCPTPPVLASRPTLRGLNNNENRSRSTCRAILRLLRRGCVHPPNNRRLTAGDRISNSSGHGRLVARTSLLPGDRLGR